MNILDQHFDAKAAMYVAVILRPDADTRTDGVRYVGFQGGFKEPEAARAAAEKSAKAYGSGTEVYRVTPEQWYRFVAGSHETLPGVLVPAPAQQDPAAA